MARRGRSAHQPSLGVTMMRRSMIAGKCGLPVQCPYLPRPQHRLGRAARPAMSLGTTMMRRMIGRYKGFRCARMGRA